MGTGNDRAKDIVDTLIARAVQARASDIHIEPEEKALSIRFRIDGMLQRQEGLPLELAQAVTAHCKARAGLDSRQRRLPQEGSIAVTADGEKTEVRVSTCPTVHGENIVLRIMDRGGLVLGIDTLGMPPRTAASFKELVTSGCGIILVTGPTGSGKTATLYSCLQLLNRDDVNIMTVEDTIGHRMSGVHQTQVQSVPGLTIASVLRSFLKQDPDIIMAGEIGDRETAELAIQAALTGHLVVSTLHTDDSLSAVTRLLNMGVEPFLVSSALLAVLAQRLVRTVCDTCKEAYAPSEQLLRDLGLEDRIGTALTFMRGKGCSVCSGTGYRGKTGIFELLRVSPEMQEAVLKRPSLDELRAVASRSGVRTLRHAALEKLLAGRTTAEEVMRVTLETTG